MSIVSREFTHDCDCPFRAKLERDTALIKEWAAKVDTEISALRAQLDASKKEHRLLTDLAQRQYAQWGAESREWEDKLRAAELAHLATAEQGSALRAQLETSRELTDSHRAEGMRLRAQLADAVKVVDAARRYSSLAPPRGHVNEREYLEAMRENVAAYDAKHKEPAK